MVVVEAKFSAKIFGVVVVVEYFDLSAADLHGFCRLTSASLTEVAEDDGLVWVQLKSVLLCDVV